LDRCGIQPARLRSDIDQARALPAARRSDMMLTPATCRVVKRASEEEEALGSDSIETEHLLLALIADADNLAARILTRRAYPDLIRELLRGYGGGPTEVIPAASPDGQGNEATPPGSRSDE